MGSEPEEVVVADVLVVLGLDDVVVDALREAGIVAVHGWQGMLEAAKTLPLNQSNYNHCCGRAIPLLHNRHSSRRTGSQVGSFARHRTYLPGKMSMWNARMLAKEWRFTFKAILGTTTPVRVYAASSIIVRVVVGSSARRNHAEAITATLITRSAAGSHFFCSIIRTREILGSWDGFIIIACK